MKSRNAFLTGVLVVTTIALAMGQHDTHMSRHSESTDPQWNGLVASMNNMDRAMMSIKSSGDGDVDFVMLMLPHHQAAINMAETQLTYGTDPQMRRLAQEIITDQQSEIQLMQVWLKQRESHQTQFVHPTM